MFFTPCWDYKAGSREGKDSEKAFILMKPPGQNLCFPGVRRQLLYLGDPLEQLRSLHGLPFAKLPNSSLAWCCAQEAEQGGSLQVKDHPYLCNTLHTCQRCKTGFQDLEK